MTTAIALACAAVIAAACTVAVMVRLFRNDEIDQRWSSRRRHAAQAEGMDALVAADNAMAGRDELERQIAALRAMVLQLRVDVAEAQRANEQSRVRDLELLRLRGAELVREAGRVAPPDRWRDDEDALTREARQLLASMSDVSPAAPRPLPI